MNQPKSNTPEDPNLRKEHLKRLIEKLHEGAPIDEVKAQFRELLSGCSPTEIAQVEEELIKEGMPAKEIHELCDVHLAVFQESLETTNVEVDPGHPVQILMEEHNILLSIANNLRKFSKTLQGMKVFEAATSQLEQLRQFVEKIQHSESHYLREENILFPYLEKHGITQPPAIMWMEHDKIREIEKTLYDLMDTWGKTSLEKFSTQLDEIALNLAEMLSSHFYKENNILFPTGLKVITDKEWAQIRKEFDDLGYCSFTPEPPQFIMEKAAPPNPEEREKGLVQFETGTLSPETIEAIFDTLPVDVTFVDKDDAVRYFSQSPERIFVRTKAVIGRNVKACHPQKSLHVVEQILNDFRAGKRDSAEFWINVKDRLIYIRYFPVRNKKAEYLGVLEVSQDITDIKAIEGEKRLLDG